MRWTSAAYVLCNDSAEPCTSDRDIGVGFPTYLHDFRANVLALAIAVRPNHEELRASCFGLEILGYSVGILLDPALDGGFEESEWIAGGPFRVHDVKIMLHNMAGDRRYGVERIGLGIVEVIILDIFVPTVPLETSELVLE